MLRLFALCYTALLLLLPVKTQEQEPAFWKANIPFSFALPDLSFFRVPKKLTDVFPECKDTDPCVIRKPNPGGVIGDYEDAAEDLLRSSRRMVVIDAPCYSSCAIFADKAREKVYIGEHAAFYFHKAIQYSFDHKHIVARFDPPQSSDIDAWVRKHYGGYPLALYKTDAFAKMDFAQAKVFWKVERVDPLPHPRAKASPPKRKKTAQFNAHALY